MEEYRICYCKYCGKEIKVYPRKDGKGFAHRTVCDDCMKSPPYKIVKCKNCGKEFKIYHLPDGKRGYERKTLCPECSKPAMTKTLICQKCGKEFTVTRTDPKKQFPNLKYCEECSKLDDYKEYTCKRCGKKFKVHYKLTKNGKRYFRQRDYCDDCLKPIDYIILTCQKCGKQYKQYRSKNGYIGYSRKYCDDCLKPETITKVCECCGKEFTVPKREAWRKTCSNPDCINAIKMKNLKKTCLAKYNLEYPCLLPQVIASNKNMHSKINENFGKLLKENNIPFKDDYRIGNYAYDFYLWNKYILVEINPTVSHTIAETGIYPAKDKNYHLNKTIYAQEHGYRCINIWDWDDWDKIIDLVKPKEKIYARKLP